eukprot:5722177-Pleurochrysis_carterae.AAC.4
MPSRESQPTIACASSSQTFSLLTAPYALASLPVRVRPTQSSRCDARRAYYTRYAMHDWIRHAARKAVALFMLKPKTLQKQESADFTYVRAHLLKSPFQTSHAALLRWLCRRCWSVSCCSRALPPSRKHAFSALLDRLVKTSVKHSIA